MFMCGVDVILFWFLLYDCIEIGSFNGKINDLVEVLEQHAVRIDEQKLRVSVVLSSCTSYQYFVEIVLFLLMECVVVGS
jgi:hypothetical protein